MPCCDKPQRFRGEPLEPPQLPMPQNESHPTFNMPIVALCIMVVGLGIFILLFVNPPTPPFEDVNQRVMKFGHGTIEAIAPEFLLAPSTATFPDDSVRCRRIDEYTWHVWGDVDTQNVFGAMYRGKWSLVIMSPDQAKTLTLVSASYEGQKFYERMTDPERID